MTDKIQFRMSSAGRCPKLNEIKRGFEIGKPQNCLHIYIACPSCGKERWIRFYKGKPRYTYCKQCAISKHHTGRKPANWKGGRILSKNGYILVRIYPDNPYFVMTDKAGYLPEHRLIVAQELSRCLETREIVHHKNGIKHDNRRENLSLVLIKEHRTSYMSGYKEGYKDRQKVQNQDLITEIRLLRLQLKHMKESQSV